MSSSSNEHNGTFHGWSMTLWGSVIDPKKAKTYVLPLVDTLLPPLPHLDQDTSGTTKSHPKPTAHLPGDHGTAEGENSKPAFPAGNGTTPVNSGSKTNSTSGGKFNETSSAIINSTSSSLTPSPSPALAPTADEGWFSDMSSLVSSQKWFFGAIALVFLFGVVAAVFFWRRRMAARRRTNYFSVASDDLPMSNVDRRNRGGGNSGSRTKDLYDAFGEVSDDDDADEETSLQPHRPNERSRSGGLGFHEGFLDDNPATAGTSGQQYRDEPEESGQLGGHDSPDHRPASDGSWEHASDAR